MGKVVSLGKSPLKRDNRARVREWFDHLPAEQQGRAYTLREVKEHTGVPMAALTDVLYGLGWVTIGRPFPNGPVLWHGPAGED